jgi:hypothetical protein
MYDLEEIKKLTQEELLAIAIQYYEFGNEVHEAAADEENDVCTIGELTLTQYDAWQ